MPLRFHGRKMAARLQNFLADLFWRLTPDCREVVRSGSGEIDHALNLAGRLRLRWHRLFCKYCARYFRQMQVIRAATRRLPDHLTGPSLPTGARARIKRVLRER